MHVPQDLWQIARRRRLSTSSSIISRAARAARRRRRVDRGLLLRCCMRRMHRGVESGVELRADHTRDTRDEPARMLQKMMLAERNGFLEVMAFRSARRREAAAARGGGGERRRR